MIPLYTIALCGPTSFREAVVAALQAHLGSEQVTLVRRAQFASTAQLHKALHELKQGRTAQTDSATPGESTLEPASYLLVEGADLLDPAQTPSFDFTVWVPAPTDTQTPDVDLVLDPSTDPELLARDIQRAIRQS